MMWALGWADIFGREAPHLVLPTAHPDAYRIGRRPRCPDDCRGHSPDGVIACRHCGGVAYQVLGHRWPHREDSLWWSLEPMNGSPAADSSTPMCCGLVMERRWK